MITCLACDLLLFRWTQSVEPIPLCHSRFLVIVCGLAQEQGEMYGQKRKVAGERKTGRL